MAEATLPVEKNDASGGAAAIASAMAGSRRPITSCGAGSSRACDASYDPAYDDLCLTSWFPTQLISYAWRRFVARWFGARTYARRGGRSVSPVGYRSRRAVINGLAGRFS